MIGIYGIKNKVNLKTYVGQSITIPYRFTIHQKHLMENRHFNSCLQEEFNQFGINNFDFLVLEKCQDDLLDEKEKQWIKELRETTGVYNVRAGGENLRGNNNPFFGKKHTDEAKNKMSVSKSKMYVGSNNPNYGKQQTHSTKLKMAINNSGTKLNPDKVLEIKNCLLAGEDHLFIANKYKISRTVITRISNGTRWSNITGGPVMPVVYNDAGIRQLSTTHKMRIGKSHQGMKYKRKVVI
jgi:group I intron endonuclease